MWNWKKNLKLNNLELQAMENIGVLPPHFKKVEISPENWGKNGFPVVSICPRVNIKFLSFHHNTSDTTGSATISPIS